MWYQSGLVLKNGVKVIDNSLNPVWVSNKPKDYCFDFIVHDQHHQVINIEVYDKDKADKDDLLGECKIHLSEVLADQSAEKANPDDTLEKWYNLRFSHILCYHKAVYFP